jgi:hypothetical protein
MKVDVDTKERIKTIFIFLLQSYKVLMGSMLVLFVPQSCGNSICSITDNLYREGDLHRTSLAFNFLSTLCFVTCYTIELNRENWCIEHLDISDDYGDNNLPLVLKERPELEKALHKINDRYYYSSQITAGVYSVNLVLSTTSIYFNHSGTNTITAYMSFVILILMKLYNALFISNDSKKNNMALSAYMSELQSYNVIDKDHIIIKDNDQQISEYKYRKSFDDKDEIKADNVIVANLTMV